MVLEIPGKILGQEDVRETPTGALTSAEAAPIGSILPWLKSFTNTPSLPDGWVECDGSVLSDSASVYNGQTLPDLNGDNQFPRGNSTSGGTGGAAVHGHYLTAVNAPPSGQIGTGDSNSSKTDSESNLPPYYNVVWIMRIK